MEMSKQCLQCGQTIMKPYKESLKNWNTRHRFCSRKCHNDWRRGKYWVNSGSFGQREYTPWLKGTKGVMKSNSGSFKKGMIPWCKGKRRPDISGKKNNNWKGGITELRKKIRKLPEYKQWVKSIFQRDGYKCTDCGKKGYIHAHHYLKSFSEILQENQIKTLEQAINCQELWDIINGKTLCISCHNKKPEHYGLVDYSTRRKRQKRDTGTKTCIVCGNEFIRKETEGFVAWDKRKYCSHKCYEIIAGELLKGRPVSQETKNKISESLKRTKSASCVPNS